MLKENYYCLVAGLPDLVFDENNQVYSRLEFREELKNQLSKADSELVDLLYLADDNKHILNLHLEKVESLDYNDAHPVAPLSYIIDFLEWAEDKEHANSKLLFENKLQSLYYDYVLSAKSVFLQEWFQLELNIRNIRTAFNCIEYNYLAEKHLIKLPQNNTVYSLLINKHLKYELFEDEVPNAKQIFAIAESKYSSEKKEFEIDKMLWDYLDEQTCYHYFEIEKILSHIIKLGIIERWTKLNEETGKAFLSKLIEDIKLSYKFSKEFSTVK